MYQIVQTLCSLISQQVTFRFSKMKANFFFASHPTVMHRHAHTFYAMAQQRLNVQPNK